MQGLFCSSDIMTQCSDHVLLWGTCDDLSHCNPPSSWQFVLTHDTDRLLAGKDPNLDDAHTEVQTEPWPWSEHKVSSRPARPNTHRGHWREFCAQWKELTMWHTSEHEYNTHYLMQHWYQLLIMSQSNISQNKLTNFGPPSVRGPNCFTSAPRLLQCPQAIINLLVHVKLIATDNVLTSLNPLVCVTAQLSHLVVFPTITLRKYLWIYDAKHFTLLHKWICSVQHTVYYKRVLLPHWG